MPPLHSALKNAVVGWALLVLSCSKIPEAPANTFVSRQDHERYFLIASGGHATVDCDGCHGNFDSFSEDVSCTTCHPPSTTDGLHADVGGYEQVSWTCLKCHGDSQVNLISAHVPFHIDTGYKHYRVPCYSCHTTTRATKPFAIEFLQFDCLGCHPSDALAPTHLVLPGYQYDTPTCVSSGCHANGARP